MENLPQPVEEGVSRRRRRKGKQKAVEESSGIQGVTHQPEKDENLGESSISADKESRTRKASPSQPVGLGPVLAIDSADASQPVASSSKLPPPPAHLNGLLPAPKKRKRARDSDGKRLNGRKDTKEPPSKKIKKEKKTRQYSGHDDRKVFKRTEVQVKSKGKEKEVLDDADLAIPAWPCVPLTQNEILRIPPVWSKDGRYYFVVADTSIHVHSFTPPTFARVSTLSSNQPDGHKQPITSLVLSPINPLHLITSSEDGTIKIWDWSEGRLVRTIPMYGVPCNVRHLCVAEVGGKWWIFVTLTHERKKGDKTAKQKMKIEKKRKLGIIRYHHRVVRALLEDHRRGSARSYWEIGRLSAPSSAIFVSPRSKYLVALAGNKAYTYRLPSTATGGSGNPLDWEATLVKFVSDQPFTCGAFAPETNLNRTSQEEWFATGDTRGIIRLWHGLEAAFRQFDAAAARSPGPPAPGRSGLPDMEKRLPTTSLHWHAHAVAAIAFTPSGTQLLSVGEESVLVQWHLASGKREYIPRLGGSAILSLAVKRGSRGVEEEWWMGFADGSVVRVGAASGTISTVGQGIRLGEYMIFRDKSRLIQWADPLRATSNDMSCPLALHPATGSLVVPSSHPSTLQFIDPLTSSVLFDLEVAPSNRISRRDEQELQPVAVELVAFSDTQNGESRWMATVEGRKGDEVEGGGLVKTLKIWRWDESKYVINTQYPRPHGLSDISTLTFSPLRRSTTSVAYPASPYLLTTSIEGNAKMWHVRQAQKSEQGKTATKKPVAIELFWSTRSSFDYRSMPIYDSAFSPDATITALVHGEVITLWDVESNVLLKVLADTAVSDARKATFVGPEGRYLAAGGASSGIAVWDLLSCEVVWSSASNRCDKLLAHPIDSTFTAFYHGKAGRTVAVIHSPTESTPLRRRVVPTRLDDMRFRATANKTFEFVGIAKTGEIYRFGDNVSSPAPQPVRVIEQATKAKPLSIWQEMFGKDAFIDDLEPAKGITSPARIRKVGRPSEVFEGPSHTMPPVGLLFDAFMDELLSAEPGDQKEEDIKPADSIVYDEPMLPAPVQPDPVVEESRTRTVTDEDVRGLEVFFREILTTSTSNLFTSVSSTERSAESSGAEKPVKPLPNGHVHLPNGNIDPDSPRLSPVIQAATSKGNGIRVNSVKEQPNGISADSEAKDYQSFELGENAGGNKKGRKRKAPREA